MPSRDLAAAPLILGLWSIVLQPGQTLPQKTTPAIQITNISYGAEVKGDARSVVSIKYPEFEQDSDDEDEDEDDEDEEDEDEEEEADEDDEEGSDGDIKLPKIITKEAVLAILKPNQTEQVSLNISLVEDVEIVEFSVTGDNAVHLVGHYIRQEDFDQDPYSDDDFDEDDEDIDSDFITDDEDDEDVDMSALIGGSDDDEDEEEDASRFAEIKELVNDKKRAVAEEEEEEEQAGDVSLSKNQKKKLAKKLKAESGAAAPAPAAAPAAKKAEAPVAAKAPAAAAKPVARTLPGGLIVLDSKIGTGPQAKSGSRVGMRYIGKLENGKVFDRNVSGTPFSTVLGRGEVIKGWDQGLIGMQVGGERRITCPPAFGYGKRGAGKDIPPNSTLVFDLKLVSLK